MAGLNNSGKTSILLLLNRKFSLLSSIKPTFKAKRSLQSLSLLGVTISHWDLGGQESFRKIYLEQKEKYFADAQSIFFVIDIQQAVRYGEAIKYLSEILRVTKEMEQELPNLLILFHKYDPDIKNDPEINKEISELQDKIRTIDNGFKFTFYKTSIYDEPSLLKAFSDGVISMTAKAKLIQTLLKEYTRKSFNSAAVLLDRHCFIIASRATKPDYERICEEIAPRLTQSIEKLEDWDINTIDIVTNIEFLQKNSENSREGLIFLRKIDINEERLYLIALCLNKKIKTKSYEYLPLLASNLKNLLESFE